MTFRTLATTLALLVTSPVFAQNAPSQGWVDFNFISLHSQQGAQVYTLTSSLFDETASATSTYPALPTANGGELGGGVNLARHIGLGIHFNTVSYQYPVGLALNIPHPFFFNRSASDADTTDGTLERRDRNLDVLVMYSLPTPDAWRVRLFGGPSYFTVRQEMVEEIEFAQLVNFSGANIVEITSSRRREVDNSAWGYNVGVDAAYFFSRHVGIGGVVRFNRATVAIDEEPLTRQQSEVRAGATAVGAGVRFRF